MYFSGFADEAGASIDVQIRATKELGWSFIESRNVDGVNLTDITDEKFDEVCEKLETGGVRVNCFGSAVANWSKHPRSEADYQSSLESLRRAIPRMQRLGTRMIRGMSFAVPKEEPPDNPELEKVIFDKVRSLVRICEESDILYLHENCMNYGGLSHEHTLRLIDQVNSSNFKLVFDTGNPVGTDRRIGSPPYPKQSSWEFYIQVKPFIHYVHIKDCIFEADTDGIFPRLRHTFPGEGHGDVVRIMTDMLETGYDGGLSIEPHLAALYHDPSITSTDEIRYLNYVEYGRRLMKLVEEVRPARRSI
jgi:sugar phosphate isomerase/epimerase